MEAGVVTQVLKESAQEFSKDKAPRLSAALAYYTLFSLAPLLVIVVAVAGLMFDQATAREKIIAGLGQVLGEEGQKGVVEMISSAGNKEKTGIVATVIGFLTLLFGASGVFGQLKDALNSIWDVPPKKEGGVMTLIKDRFLSFTMVLGVGFLLLVSLVVSAAVTAFTDMMSARMLGGGVVAQVVTFAVSVGIIAVLFAALFKYLPDKKIAWADVWAGAFFTSLLFNIGKLVIGYYLGRGSIGSSFGAAASLAILLVWLYYSGMIFFFGAEFTEVWSRARKQSSDGKWEPRKRPADELTAAPALATIGGQRKPLPVPTAARAKEKVESASGAGKKMAAAGAAGVVVGALAGTVGAAMVLVKGVRKVLRLS
jgi:membrane protein